MSSRLIGGRRESLTLGASSFFGFAAGFGFVPGLFLGGGFGRPGFGLNGGFAGAFFVGGEGGCALPPASSGFGEPPGSSSFQTPCLGLFASSRLCSRLLRFSRS